MTESRREIKWNRLGVFSISAIAVVIMTAQLAFWNRRVSLTTADKLEALPWELSRVLDGSNLKAVYYLSRTGWFTRQIKFSVLKNDGLTKNEYFETTRIACFGFPFAWLFVNRSDVRIMESRGIWYTYGTAVPDRLGLESRLAALPIGYPPFRIAAIGISGLMTNTVLIILAELLLCIVYGFIITARRRQLARCISCDYPLMPAGSCPECGKIAVFWSPVISIARVL